MKDPTWHMNSTGWQWQTSLTAHDPFPPITLEDAPAPPATGRTWMLPLVGVGSLLLMILGSIFYVAL